MGVTMRSFGERLKGAARLDVRVYEEVEADRGATGQALLVVVLSSVATGIGSLGGDALLQDFVFGAVGALVGWLLWAFLTFVIGTKVLPEPTTRSNPGELLRTTGFAAAPNLLRVLGVVPLAGGIVMLATSLWTLVAFVVAVRQALDYRSTLRAVGVCVIGWLVWVPLSLAMLLLPLVW